MNLGNIQTKNITVDLSNIGGDLFGVNGGFFENVDFKFGANCYGTKPSPKPNELEKSSVGDDLHNPYEAKIEEYRQGANRFRISPFNEENWSSE